MIKPNEQLVSSFNGNALTVLSGGMQLLGHQNWHQMAQFTLGRAEKSSGATWPARIKILRYIRHDINKLYL